jgi:retron-type reverse transcriptase
MLARKFKDPDLLWLLYLIIDSPEMEFPQKGIPIGSLTSQLFANLYLDRLDHYIKDVLEVKAYLRYMDDFIIFANDKSELHLLHAKIKAFLGKI